jgi:hypothetical protein
LSNEMLRYDKGLTAKKGRKKEERRAGKPREDL